MGIVDSLAGFSYSNFRGLGSLILRAFPQISAKLESAGIRIHPEAYASVVAAITLISAMICIPSAVITYLLTQSVIYPIIVGIIPLLVLLMGVAYPYGEAASKASVLESEVPYAATYLAVMATGGIPPYTSLRRIARSELMPNLARAARMAEIQVSATGLDPVTAIENMAKGIPSKEYRDLLMGYASTLRSGGDVVHFLIRKTETIFEARTNKMRIVGERMGMLMEAYASTVMMLSLVVYIMYIISRAMPTQYMILPPGQFVIIAYLIMPMLASVFLYLADISQPKYPLTDTRPYKAFMASIPIAIAFLALFVTPFYIVQLKAIPPFNMTSSLIVRFREILGLDMGYEASIALCLFFIFLFIPGAVAWEKYGKENYSILHGLTLFTRDLTEARKTGMSPEKCIMTLAERGEKAYGGFTKHLKIIARQTGWGLSLRRIYQDFERRVYGWLARAGVFIMIDAIDVGGGAPETFDVLATFMEDLEEMEKNKRAALRPLLLIPYITAIILVMVVVILISFMKSLLKLARVYISVPEFVHLFLPPVVLIAVISGLVAGKVSDGTVAAGFKHAVIMAVITLVAIWLSGSLGIQLVAPPPTT